MTKPHSIPPDARHALAVLTHRFRRTVNGPTWDIPGIQAAIDQCGEPPCETAAALFALAADPTIRTPGMLRHPGSHWPEIGGTRTEPAHSYTMTCHAHPTEPVPCRPCADAIRADPPRPESIQAAYDALHHRTQPPVPRVTQPALDEEDQ